jgi:hypothetical protein
MNDHADEVALWRDRAHKLAAQVDEFYEIIRRAEEALGVAGTSEFERKYDDRLLCEHFGCKAAGWREDGFTVVTRDEILRASGDDICTDFIAFCPEHSTTEAAQ